MEWVIEVCVACIVCVCIICYTCYKCTEMKVDSVLEIEAEKLVKLYPERFDEAEV